MATEKSRYEIGVAALVVAWKWLVGGVVTWLVVPAFAGKGTVVFVQGLIEWSGSTKPASYLFPIAFLLACAWAWTERHSRQKLTADVQQRVRALEDGPSPSPKALASASEQVQDGTIGGAE